MTESGSSLQNPMYKSIGFGVAVYLVFMLILGFYWSREPDRFNVNEVAREMASENGRDENIIGYTTTATIIHSMTVLLDKPGGFLSNDLSPLVPGGFYLDNIPNWEKGALQQLRDLTRVLRKNISRSQSQSQEDKDLPDAEEKFYFSMNSWLVPRSETRYAGGIDSLEQYLLRLSDPNEKDAQFYARADNLGYWLAEVETRLGSLSQRLSASVGKRQLNVDLAGDSAAAQSTKADADMMLKTPWTELDDVFYEARGSTWALIHLLQAIEKDFEDILKKKNALISLQQIIRELEPTQDFVYWPIILNGDGFGVVANHSLVMASYIARANAAIIDLRKLLQEG